MCSTALKDEIYERVEPMTDARARLVIKFIDSLDSASQSTGQVDLGAIERESLFGILPGNTVIAEDFFETPECFKEYM